MSKDTYRGVRLDDEPRFTTPHMIKSQRSQSKNRLNQMTKKRKRRREFNSGKFTVVLLALVVVLLVIFAGWGLFRKNAQAIKINNETVDYIKDVKISTEEFNQLVVAKLNEKTGNNVQLKDTVTLVPVHVNKKGISTNTESVITSILGKLTYKQEAASITVNGEEKALLATKEEAEKLLNEILDIYKPKDDPEVKDVKFVEDVQVVSRFADLDEVMTSVKASDILRSASTQSKTYTVQSGDSFSGIASKFDMTEAELLKANPTITKDTMHKLKIDQELNITVPVPVLSAKLIKEEVEQVDIEPPVKTVENPKEYKTYRKVISAGKKGKKEVVTQISYINGVEDSREVVNEKVLEEATPQTVEVGTLNP